MVSLEMRVEKIGKNERTLTFVNYHSCPQHHNMGTIVPEEGFKERESIMNAVYYQ